MRVLAPLLTLAASIFTIGAAVVRVKWASVQRYVQHSDHIGSEGKGLPRWVRKFLGYYLLAILVGGSLFVIIFFIKTFFFDLAA